VSFCGLQGEAAQTHHLIEKNQRGKHDRDADCERRIGEGQAELIWANLVGVRPPQDYPRGEPLKCESGGVERDAIHFCGAGHLHQLADAAATEHRHGDAENEQNGSKIPMHDGK
jgi:hypothetical protein